jgi:hypothetical protein
VRSLRAPLLWSAGLGALLWLPPVIGALTGEPGNVGILVRYFLDAPDPPLGVGRAVRTMAAEFAWRPPWLGGPYRVQAGFAVGASPLWLFPPVALLAAGWYAARRAGRRDDTRLTVAAGVALGVGVLAISRADIAFAYTFEWRAVLAGFVVAVGLVPFAHLLVASRPERRVRALTGIATALVVVTAAVAVPKLADRPLGEDLQPAAMVSVHRAIARLPELSGRRVLVLDSAGPYPVQALRTGIVDELDRRGAEVRQSGLWRRSTGARRVAGPRAVDEVWALVVGDGAVADAAAAPGARVVWRARPEGSVDRDARSLRAALRAQLLAAGHPELLTSLDLTTVDPRLADVPGLDPRFVALLANRQRAAALLDPCRCAIVVTPGGRAAR